MRSEAVSGGVPGQMRMLLEFEKGERVRHLGLLDLQRTMQRALRRSGLPVAYSNGFNPHIVMAFASALSSGIPGEAELLDVLLSEDTTAEECLSALKRALPPDLQPVRVRLVDNGFPKCGKLLERASYRFHVSAETAETVIAAVPGFLAQKEIFAVRKSKTKETLVNIRPMIHRLSGEMQSDGTGVLLATVSFTDMVQKMSWVIRRKVLLLLLNIILLKLIRIKLRLKKCLLRKRCR